jgi:hypothetical protein
MTERDERPCEERETKTAVPRVKFSIERFGLDAVIQSAPERYRTEVPHHLRRILRKEVIQPQVPLRLPCYDFTPVADLTVADCPLAVGASS